MADLNNKKLQFLNGTQSSLDKLKLETNKTKCHAGAFYLTTDTHRLYLCLEDEKAPVPVNQGVQFFTYLSEAKTAINANNDVGSLYYVKNDKIENSDGITEDVPLNALCIWNGKELVQINPDTDTKVEDVSFVKDKETGNLQLQVTSGKTPYAAGIDFAAGNSNITIEKTITNGDLTVTLSVPAGDIFKIKAANVTDNKEVQLQLRGSKEDELTTSSDVNIVSGDNVQLKVNNNNAIEISATDTTITDFSGFNLNDPDPNTETETDKPTSGFELKIIDSNNAQGYSAYLDPKVKIDTTNITFKDGIADITDALNTRIDDKISGINALHYNGVVSTISDLKNKTTDSATGQPVPIIGIGEVYLYNGTKEIVFTTSDKTGEVILDSLNQPSDSRRETLYPGDLLVSQGTEVDGVITDKISWAIIPAGDIDTTYQLEHEGNKTVLKTKTNAETGFQNEAGSFTINGDGTKISVTQSSTDENSTYTISHIGSYVKNTDVKTSMAAKADGPKKGNSTVDIIVEENTYDNFGHLESTNKNTYTVTDTHNDLDDNGTYLDASGSEQKVTLTQNLKTLDGTTLSPQVTFSTSTLTLTPTAKNGATYADINIDMLWGEF